LPLGSRDLILLSIFKRAWINSISRRVSGSFLKSSEGGGRSQRGLKEEGVDAVHVFWLLANPEAKLLGGQLFISEICLKTPLI